MKASLRALLTGALDYAGLFPPASLPTEEAVRNFARYRKEPEGWLLGRFVCQTSRLVELNPVRAHMASGPPWGFTIIAKWAGAAGTLGAGLLPEHRLLEEFLHEYSGRATVDAYEAFLPISVNPGIMISVDDPADLDRLAPQNITRNLVVLFQERFRFGAFASMPLFGEAPVDGSWRELTPIIVGVLAERETRDFGFKIRCGGTSAPPEAEQLAFTITTCRDARVPLKFTAGLHQPLRHGTTHGFVNVFVAGALAHARGLDTAQVQAIIEDQDPASFRFDDDQLHWRDVSATTEEVTAARRHLVGFGSCSFDEPREGLRALGWLS